MRVKTFKSKKAFSVTPASFVSKISLTNRDSSLKFTSFSDKLTGEVTGDVDMNDFGSG